MTFELDDRLARAAFVNPRIAPRRGNRHNVRHPPGRQRPGIAVSPARWFARTSQVTEAIMSDAFQDRENTFEKQFAHDEDLRFKAVARRNKAVALWVAETKGLSGADAEKYASDFVGAQIGKSDADVEAALKADLERGNVDLSDHRLRKKMDEAMAAAVASVRAGK
jgi:hypothetical protein